MLILTPCFIACGLGSIVEYAHLVSWPSVVRGNWTRVVLFCCILGCLLFLICIEFFYLYFPVLFCLSVSVKWLAVKTASEMAYIVSSGALNSTPTYSNQQLTSWAGLTVSYHMVPSCLTRRAALATSISRRRRGGRSRGRRVCFEAALWYLSERAERNAVKPRSDHALRCAAAVIRYDGYAIARLSSPLFACISLIPPSSSSSNC